MAAVEPVRLRPIPNIYPNHTQREQLQFIEKNTYKRPPDSPKQHGNMLEQLVVDRKHETPQNCRRKSAREATSMLGNVPPTAQRPHGELFQNRVALPNEFTMYWLLQAPERRPEHRIRSPITWVARRPFSELQHGEFATVSGAQ